MPRITKSSMVLGNNTKLANIHSSHYDIVKSHIRHFQGFLNLLRTYTMKKQGLILSCPILIKSTCGMKYMLQRSVSNSVCQTPNTVQILVQSLSKRLTWVSNCSPISMPNSISHLANSIGHLDCRKSIVYPLNSIYFMDLILAITKATKFKLNLLLKSALKFGSHLCSLSHALKVITRLSEPI